MKTPLTLVNHFYCLVESSSLNLLVPDVRTQMCPQPKKEERIYFLLGVLCGLAFFNQNIVHLPFPLVLFKKLLRVKPSLDDLREFDPVRGEYVLEMHCRISCSQLVCP